MKQKVHIIPLFVNLGVLNYTICTFLMTLNVSVIGSSSAVVTGLGNCVDMTDVIGSLALNSKTWYVGIEAN